jgi:hypothetical protein
MEFLMKHFIFSALLFSFMCTHAMDTDEGIPTWKQLDEDIKKKIYEPCDRNLFTHLLLGTNTKCHHQKLSHYRKEREDAFKCACAKLHGEENLKVKIVDKPVVEVTLEEFKKSLSEPMQTPQTIPQIESKKFLECVREKDQLLFNRMLFIFNRDGNPSNW